MTRSCWWSVTWGGRMDDSRQALADEYKSGLLKYLNGGGEAALHGAYELGRRVLAEDLGVLAMAELHHKALRAVLSLARSGKERSRKLAAAERFLSESLASFEISHRAFRDTSTTLRGLNERLEEEARRIAHALHDEAGQFLASAHILLADIQRESPLGVRERLEEVREFLNQVEDQLRNLSHELRPTILDDLGLVPALEFLSAGVSKRTGISVAMRGSTERRLPRPVETNLYRIVQEALNNVARHAKAKKAEIRVWREKGVVHCSIRDDGIGFDAPRVLSEKGRPGLGLTGIRERLGGMGGTFAIHSAPGRGTDLRVSINLEEVHVFSDCAGR